MSLRVCGQPEEVTLSNKCKNSSSVVALPHPPSKCFGQTS